MKAFASVLTPALLFLWALPAGGQRAKPPRTVRVGVVVDGPWTRNAEMLRMFQQEVAELCGDEFDVRFGEEMRVEADWTLAGVRAALDRLLGDPRVDIVVPFGVIGSYEAARREQLKKPVIAPLVINPAFEGIPLKDGKSGRRNLSYLGSSWSLRRDLEVFYEIVRFKKLAILANRNVLEAVPDLAGTVERQAAKMAAGSVRIPVGDRVDEAFAALPADTDAVYVGPLLHLSAEEFDKFTRGLIERRLPSFSLLGESEVRRGLLTGIAPEEGMQKLVRRVAIHVHRILLGDDPAELPVAFDRGERVTINMATARAIGLWPPWKVMTEAVLLNERPSRVGRRLDLAGAIREAVAANRDLAAAGIAVESGAEDIRRARSRLLPRVELSGTGRVIDEDRAAASSGSAPERQISANGRLSWALFSEQAWAGFSVEKSLQRSREARLEQVRLDIIVDAAVAYLNVLRAKTFERIQKDNLAATRANLELARVRVDIGTSGMADIHRWESQIANDRASVIEANSRRNVAEIEMNRLLHRPLEESFATSEAALDDPELITSDERFFRFLSNPWSFRQFRRFMVEQGLVASPEIRQIDRGIEARQRGLDSDRRRFWVPTLGMQAEATRHLAEGGAGTAGISIPGVGSLPQADDTNWTLAGTLSLPLFEGADRFAAVAKGKKEMARLREERAAVTERIEQGVRSSLHLAGASLARIDLARESADAARKNFEITQDAYAKGAVPILTLLDAQRAALVSEQLAANAVHDFLIDMALVDRAVGGSSPLLTRRQRDAWIGRVEKHLQEVGDAE